MISCWIHLYTFILYNARCRYSNLYYIWYIIHNMHIWCLFSKKTSSLDFSMKILCPIVELFLASSPRLLGSYMGPEDVERLESCRCDHHDIMTDMSEIFRRKQCMIHGPKDFQEWPPEMPWKWWKGHDVFSKKKATFFYPPFFLPLKECLILSPYKRVVIQRSHPGLRSFKIWMPWRTTETPGILSGWKNGKV